MASNIDNYICLSAMLKARSNNLLGSERAERMINADSFEDCAKMLTEIGYEDFTDCNAFEIEQNLEKHKAEIFYELGNLCPDSKLIDIFKTKDDYHNAKVILKSEGMNLESPELYSYSGRIDPERLHEAYTQEQYHEMPEDLAKAIKEGKEVLSKTGNPQAADFVLDRHYFIQICKLADSIDNKFITDYVKLLIDAANLKSITRAYKLGKNENLLKDAIIDGGTVLPYFIFAASDFDSKVSLYNSSKLSESVQFAQAAYQGGRMTDFEKSIDNSVMEFLHSSALINYGPEVVVWYLAVLESELTAVRMIMTCRLAGVKSEVIMERLRDMYA